MRTLHWPWFSDILIRFTQEVWRAEDSRSAQVFVTLDGDDSEAERSLEGLTAAVGYIRREVAENLHLRRPPELYFHLDRSDQYGARIDELLGRTRKKKK